MKSIALGIISFSRKYMLLHVLFWIFSYVYLVHIKLITYSPGFLSYVDAAIIKLFHILCVYTVVLCLLPAFFYKKKYLKFIFLTLGAITACTVLTVAFQNLEVYMNAGGNILNIPVLLLTTFVDNFLYTLIFFAIYIISDKYYTEKRNNRLEKIQLESELRFLKSQIHPHFLFNALNSIYVLMEENKQLAGETLIRFSDLLRHQLYYCSNKESIGLSKEIDFLKDYVDIEVIRNTNLKVNFETTGNYHQAVIAPFILTAFVENALKHVSHSMDGYYIDVRICVEENVLNFAVRNSYDSNNMPGDEQHKAGVGLQNVSRRLQLLYPGKYRLSVDKLQDVFCVQLQLELYENEMHTGR